jgi:hypothetical protein
MSGGVCELRNEIGGAEHRATLCHLCFCVKLGDSATTTHGKFQQVFVDAAISRAQAFR